MTGRAACPASGQDRKGVRHAYRPVDGRCRVRLERPHAPVDPVRARRHRADRRPSTVGGQPSSRACLGCSKRARRWWLRRRVQTARALARVLERRDEQLRLLSPLLASIALSVLHEHLHAPWKPRGPMSTRYQRSTRAGKGRPNWRIVRYADDCAPRTLTEVAM